MRRFRKAKIVATIGPSSADKKAIRALFDAGVDVFRFNFSHGTHEEHRIRYEIVREVECETGRPIAVLADLQGPKLRIGAFANSKITLRNGQKFILDSDLSAGDETRVTLPHPELFEAIEADHNLLLDDGKLRLKVIENDGKRIYTEVTAGGVLSDRKGVNLPDAVLPIPALTEKDRIDLEFALSLDVDWIALSFVQRPEDVIEVKKIVNGRAKVITKLEKPSALDSLERIVDQSDAVMVARGDLGVELPLERVPGIQKRILRICSQYGKPSIVATQMLESMISSPMPTRAEASDVASAVFDGADAVMLSAESASGAYPVETVSMMDRIITEVERDPIYQEMLSLQQNDLEIHSSGDAICAALRQVSRNIGAPVIVSYTTTGHTGLRAARERPRAYILSVTPELKVARRMALVWGVHSVLFGRELKNVVEMTEAAVEIAKKENFAEAGQSIVVAAGIPFGKQGTTNLLRIAEIN